MKNRFVALCFVMGISALAQAMGSEPPTENPSVATLYLCDPRNRNTNFEGVTLREDNSVGIYTTSQSWGAVDEHIFASEVSMTEKTFVYTTSVATLTINKKLSGTIHLGDQVLGSFFDLKSQKTMDLSCEYMLQPK